MKMAIEIAKNGAGYVNPNPLVGCIIVKGNKVLAKGYHKFFGGFHAEKEAILSCKEDLSKATLYVNLEPCCHHGKTPPCTKLILENKIRSVVIGCLDPNPLVSGKGVKYLKDNGVEVTVGILEDECKKLNETFFHFIKNKVPFITMKYAMTLDGKICTQNGESKWITNDISRANVHKTRTEVSGILVGINTVIKDNPNLTVRNGIKGKNPKRIICDSNLKISMDSNIVKTAKNIETYIACCSPNESKIKLLEKKGVKIITTNPINNRVNLKELALKLGKLNIDSLLLEGGGTLNYSFLENNLVNKIHCYIAPKVFGGYNAKTPVEGLGINSILKSFNFKVDKVKYFKDDILIEYSKIKKR